MKRKSKFISGQNITNRRSRIFFTKEDKIRIIQDYLASGVSKRDIWEKHTGYSQEHGVILRWMREYGYTDPRSRNNPNFGNKNNRMKKKDEPTNEKETFENLQLKKRINELEKQLKDAEMKAIAYSTMVDIAEKEFNISIKKKCNTKPSKK